jgi:hypothetical protein
VQEQIEVAMSAQGIDKTQIDMGMLTTAYKIGQDAVRNRADLIGKPEEQKIVADEATAAALAFLKANLPVSSAGEVVPKPQGDAGSSRFNVTRVNP